MDPKTVKEPDDPHMKGDVANLELYWSLFWGTIAAYVVLLGIAWATWDVGPVQGLNIGFPIAAAVTMHFLLSWGVVQPDQWAALYFYGRALRELPPGPYFMPRGLMQIRTAPKGLQQFQAPGEPEQVYHGDDKTPLPIGPDGKQMVRPIRITTRAPKEGENGHLDVQMTFEWSFYVQYQILDFFKFISIVGDFDHAARLIRDTGEAVLNEFASEMTVNGMIENLKTINQTLDNRVRELVNTWGMQVYETRALAPNLSHTLATELRNVPVTNLKAEQTRTTADATRYKLAEEGKGAASAEEALLLARAKGRGAFLREEADGLKAKKEALEVSGETIVAAEVASDAFDKADSIMVGGGDGVRDLLGAVAAGKSFLNQGGKKAA